MTTLPGIRPYKLPSRQVRWARSVKAQLRSKLGSVCKLCGSDTNIEFDCIEPQGDKHHKLGTVGRASFYSRQLALGNLQLLCSCCHQRKSAAEHGTTVATTFPPAAGRRTPAPPSRYRRLTPFPPARPEANLWEPIKVAGRDTGAVWIFPASSSRLLALKWLWTRTP